MDKGKDRQITGTESTSQKQKQAQPYSVLACNSMRKQLIQKNYSETIGYLHGKNMANRKRFLTQYKKNTSSNKKFDNIDFSHLYNKK